MLFIERVRFLFIASETMRADCNNDVQSFSSLRHQKRANKFSSRVFYSFTAFYLFPLCHPSALISFGSQRKMSRKFFNCDRIMQIACCIMCIKSKRIRMGLNLVNGLSVRCTSNQRTREAQKRRKKMQSLVNTGNLFTWFPCTLNMFTLVALQIRVQ